MNSIAKLLTKEPVQSISVRDILTFISMYPEWLSRINDCWDDIVQVRSHIFHGGELEESVRSQMLEFFLCDLIQISLMMIYVFDEFIITEDSRAILTKYRGEEIDAGHYKGISLPFQILLRDRELSGVSFLLNMLREVIENDRNL